LPNFSSLQSLPEVINNDPTVWLDGAEPANTCIPPSVAGNAPVQPCGIPTPKNTFESLKNIKIWSDHFLIFKKSERV
jgi:hypothetical protein